MLKTTLMVAVQIAKRTWAKGLSPHGTRGSNRDTIRQPGRRVEYGLWEFHWEVWDHTVLQDDGKGMFWKQQWPELLWAPCPLQNALSWGKIRCGRESLFLMNQGSKDVEKSYETVKWERKRGKPERMRMTFAAGLNISSWIQALFFRNTFKISSLGPTRSTVTMQ